MRAAILLLGLFLISALSGCTSTGRVPPASAQAAPCQMPVLSVPVDAPLSEAQLNAFVTDTPGFCQQTDGPLQALLLSGGGADAAYGAGVVSGLVARDQATPDSAHPPPWHPCYITGVSAGAMLAPFAYLATAQDPALQARYLPRLQGLSQIIDDDKVLSLNLPWRILSRKSVYQAEPIAQGIQTQLDDTLLADLAQEYQHSGRKLYIGVVDAYRGLFEIIDLTALIAQAAQQPSAKACVYDSIRASAAIPVVFEPVAMQSTQGRKLYMDGGMRYPLFLNSALLEHLRAAAGQQQRPVQVLAVVNHPGLSQPLAADLPDVQSLDWRRYMTVVGEVSRNQRMTDSAFTVQTEAQRHGYHIAWANGQMAAACLANKNQRKLFDSAFQQCLFAAGKQQALSSQPWANAPLLPAMHQPTP